MPDGQANCSFFKISRTKGRETGCQSSLQEYGSKGGMQTRARESSTAEQREKEPCLMSAHMEVGVLLLQFPLRLPDQQCPNSRSYFFVSFCFVFISKHSRCRQSVDLIEQINEIRAPNQFSVSMILLASPMFPPLAAAASRITSSYKSTSKTEDTGQQRAVLFFLCASCQGKKISFLEPQQLPCVSHQPPLGQVPILFRSTYLYFFGMQGSLPDT